MKSWIICIALITTIASCKNSNEDDKQDAAAAERMRLVESLQKRVQQNPDSAGVRMQLINALDSMRMYKEALAQTDSMIKRDSLNNGLWFAKAQLQESSGDTVAAIQSYNRAIAIYPSIEAQLSLANLYAEKKDPKSLMIAEAVLKMGLGRETDAYCNFIAGVYNARTGNNQEALMLFDRSIRNNYTLMEAYMEKGFVYYEQKKYTDALKVFETAVTVNNMYADAYYWQAKCYEAMNNKQEAVIYYQRSLGLDKNLKEAREALNRLG